MPATRLSLRQYEDLLDDGARHELLAGDLIVGPAPGERHSRVSTRIAWLMYGHVEQAGQGAVYTDLGFLLSREPEVTVRVPDVAYVARPVESERWLEGAPDLAVEVISPCDAPSAVEAKARMWIEAGCAAVLVVDPRERTVVLHRRGASVSLSGDERVDLDDVVPGWAPHLSAFFR